MVLIAFFRKKTHKEKTLLILLQSYALLLIFGGVFAHAGRSYTVITASVLSGMLILVGSWLLWQKKKWALFFNLLSVFGLTFFFSYRWLLTRKFYPPAFLACISLFLIFKICQALHFKKSEKKNPHFIELS